MIGVYLLFSFYLPVETNLVVEEGLQSALFRTMADK